MSYFNDKQLSTEQKITRYHSEEIKLILFICATDLYNYDEEDLEIFGECIEGRIEVLFETNYLQQSQLDEFLKIHRSTICDFNKLQEVLVSLYGSWWHMKMKDKEIWGKVNAIAKQVIKELDIDYVEPLVYMEDESHLNVDWT